MHTDPATNLAAVDAAIKTALKTEFTRQLTNPKALLLFHRARSLNARVVAKDVKVEGPKLTYLLVMEKNNES